MEDMDIKQVNGDHNYDIHEKGIFDSPKIKSYRIDTEIRSHSQMILPSPT